LAKIIDKYFHIFEKKYLKDSNSFLGIVESYIKDSCEKDEKIRENTVDERGIAVSTKPMYISNQYVKWTFCPYITKVERLNLKGKNKLSLYTKSGTIDENKAITSFASILVHSIDAHIVFIFESILNSIREELQSKGIFIDISTFTNHDNFGVNMALGKYLKIILIRFLR
jgi:hypothetical protein